MLQRHPVLSAVAALYVAGLCILSFSQAGQYVTGMVICFLVFIPLGALLVLLLGQRRWRLAIAFGILLCAWIELGRVVWHTERGFDLEMMLSNIAGMVVGALAVSLALWARERAHRESLSPLSQAGLQGLHHKRPTE